MNAGQCVYTGTMNATPHKLEVYIDFKSPYAYIAKDPIFALEQSFNVQIEWFPLTLNIGSYLGTAKKNDAGKVVENNRSARQWIAVKYAYMDCRRYANTRGLTLRGTQKIWDSSLAGIGLLFAKERSPTSLKNYIDRVYEPFWRRELDIEDPLVVQSILHDAGCPIEGFGDYLAGEGRTVHDNLQEQILDLGYFGVPTFVIDDEVYFGREHLPRVRWHLNDRPGAMPDVAYDSVL